MKRLILHIPNIDELVYRRSLIADEATMSYNIGYGENGTGCYYQTPEQVGEWYKNWNNGSGNYYAYIIRLSDNLPVGEVDIHWSEHYKKHMIGVVIEAKHRGNRYAEEALCLLANKAFLELGLDSIIDDFPRTRTAAEKAFIKVGFIRINDDVVELTRDRYFQLFPRLPSELTQLLDGYSCTKDTIGCSSAGVYYYQKDGNSLYLKIQKTNDEIRREYEILQWLNSKLPVPEVKYFCEHNGFAFLLMTAVNGHMACKCPGDILCEPYENTVKLLAEGILMLQSVDIRDCQFENTLDIKLQNALYNIQNDLVDMDDFEEDNDFDTPMELYHWLIQNKPTEESSFTHGDYCLPNIFINDSDITGFIDVGRGGIADKWQDIALCVRSLGYNLRNCDGKEKYVDLLFRYLNIKPDWDKINYYILLDELF